MLKALQKKIQQTTQWFISLSLIKKMLIILIVFGVGYVSYGKFLTKKSTTNQYQTTAAEKGTLVVSITSSGQVASANSADVTTKATGVVTKVYVQDKDQVKTGDKIADIELDLPGQQNSQAALASYQGAKNNLANAQTDMYSLQSSMYSNWDKFMNLAQNGTYQNSDGSPNTSNRTLPEFVESQDNWLASEAKYKTQQNVVNQAQTTLNSSWLSYQQTSPSIYAPISGTISGLSLQVGSVISASTSSSGTQTSTKIATVQTGASPTIIVNLTEVDVPKVSIGNKVTLTFDALPNKTFTGKIVSIDTTGSVSSGVTTYTAVIKLDEPNPHILANMNATANIITQTKDNVLLVPSAAVQTQNGTTYVRLLKNGSVVTTSVETGLSSTSQTEITSGLSAGDMVIVGLSATTSSQSIQSQSSPFSSFGRSIGGGGNTRFITR